MQNPKLLLNIQVNCVLQIQEASWLKTSVSLSRSNTSHQALLKTSVSGIATTTNTKLLIHSCLRDGLFGTWMWIVSDKSAKNPLNLIKSLTHQAIKITKLLVKIFIWYPHTVMLSSQDRDMNFISSHETVLKSLREEIIPRKFLSRIWTTTAAQHSPTGWTWLGATSPWQGGVTHREHYLVCQDFSWPTGLHKARLSSTLQSTTPTDLISNYRRWQLPSILEKVNLVLGCTDTALEMLWWTEMWKPKYF